VAEPNPGLLSELYREAFAVGEAILATLRPPMAERAFSDLAQLLEVRESIVQAAGALTQEGTPDPDALPALQRLTGQQLVLEKAIAQTRVALSKASTDMNLTRDTIGSFQRLVGSQTQSRWVDTRR